MPSSLFWIIANLEGTEVFSFASTSPLFFLAKLYAWNVNELAEDADSDMVSFIKRLKEAAVATASYSRQKWEGKKCKGDKAIDMATRLIMFDALDVPPGLVDRNAMYWMLCNAYAFDLFIMLLVCLLLSNPIAS